MKSSIATIPRRIARAVTRATCGALALCAALAGAATADDTLPPPIARVLARQGLAADSISLYVGDAARGTVLLEHLADTPRNPASVMKLVTTYAALDVLGPGYKWHTTFFVDAPIEDGVLDGNLYVRGGGDPMILVEDFLSMLFSLRQRGLAEIRGDLVVDRSYFDEASIDKAPLDDQPTRAYNAWPAALTVNFRATRFVMMPGREGIDVFAEPPSTTLIVDNRLETADGPCRGAHRGVAFGVSRGNGSTTVRLTGRYPRACGESSITRAVLDQEAYLEGAFRAIWTRLGGRLRGGLAYGSMPESARTFFDHESHPLAEVLAGTNKYSNNVMARSLLLTLGAEAYGAPGTVEAGQVAIREWLASRSLVLPGLVLDNGAGLSRRSRLTARGLGLLLADAFAHPFSDEFLASLSLVGIDGSTRRRLKNGGETGRYRLKTGLLDGVRAAAGYGLSARSTPLVIVMLQNAPTLGYASGNAVQDAVLAYLHATY